MTRETKIGLLVGLAFIIVIGILLSDHLTSSTEPPPATLVATGANVRQTTAVPGGNSSSAPITTEVHPPQVQPQATVPTRRDLQPPTNATSIVQIGGPTQQQQQPQQQLLQQPGQGSAQPQAAETDSNPPITIVGNDPPAPQQTNKIAPQQDQQVAGADAPPSNVVAPTNALAQLAQQHGETLVTMTPTGQQQVIQPTAGARTTQQQQQQPISLAGMKDYTAQPGDNLSRMAARFMGANTKANRDAIIKANSSLQEDANKVIVGKTYHIPAGGAATSVEPGQQQQQSAPVAPQRQTVVTAAATEYWYTVKEGDSLWKIANEQLGNASALTSIKELNKESLNGDTVVVGQKLRLPGKPVARAN